MSNYGLFWGNGRARRLTGSEDVTKGGLFMHTHTRFLFCTDQIILRSVDMVIVISKLCRHSNSCVIARDFALAFLQIKMTD